MNALIIYLLKVIAIQSILYLIYSIAFHKSGRHAINRFYVILALAISFIIPFMTLPNFQSKENFVERERPISHELTGIAEFSNTEAELIPVERLNQSDFTIELIVLGISLISILLLIKLIYSHFQLMRLKNQSEEIIKNGYRIYCSKIESPFSYFNAVFIPKSLLNATSFDTILHHELVHVNKKHSIDRVLMEIILSIFWFNPLLYLFRNRLIETHEFQADAEVIAIKKDPIAYQEILFQQINTQKAITSANYFKLNTIKTRIKMMNKNQKLSKWPYLLIVPALLFLTFSFANKEKSISVAPLKSDFSGVIEDVLSSSDNFTPSIFPLKDAKGVKLTKRFGKGIHPILKVERMHEGIDLATYKGNPVLATADGIVVEVKGPIFEGGYGNLIRLEHNGIYQTAYAHLSEIEVEKGDKVKKGDIIGAAGTTGRTVEPHLHYEVKEIGKDDLDPLDFIKYFDFQNNSIKVESQDQKLGESNQKLKVVIDPGHGGKDTGINSSDLSEKEIALKVANQIVENFKNSDEIEIILTRIQDEEVTLAERVSKSEGVDLFISLHTENHENEEQDQSFAIYNYTNEHSEASKYFGELMNNEFSQLNREFKVAYTDGYYILQNAEAPAILFMMGYFSNPDSEKYLNSEEGITQIAKELSDAIKASK